MGKIDSRVIKSDPFDALTRELEDFDRNFNALSSQPKINSR